MRVLIVDDQPAFRANLYKLLTAAGLTVVAGVGDIPQAETQVRALRPDMAVVDIMLPGINGLEGTRRLKALDPTLRIIVVSAYSDEADALTAAATDVGAEFFIPKQDLDLSVVKKWKDD